jgi:hypothetical protein
MDNLIVIIDILTIESGNYAKGNKVDWKNHPESNFFFVKLVP